MRVSLIFLLIGLLFLSMSAAAATQTFLGGVRGTVRDPSGGVLPGVTVTLTDEATNVPRTTFTNELGEYVFAQLAPGTYSLSRRLDGFVPYTSSGLEVGVQDFLVIDVTLDVRGIEEAITVTGETPLTQRGTASIGSTIDKAELEVLPSPNRNVFFMAVTTPGVVHIAHPFFTRQVDQNNSSLLSLGGGPVRGNNYTVDGVAITDMRNRAVVIPNLEAVEEMKVQVSTYDAEMGRTGGGVFNTIHRSGSNVWHGSGLWQNRPNWGRVRDFFEEFNDIEKLEVPYNVFGGSFGGPIVRDKTFFWMSAEGFQQTDTFSTVLTFPSQATANGDFSAAGRTIYDPLSLDANGNRLPFPGNIIPPDRLDPVGVALAEQLLSVGSGDVPVTIPFPTFGYQVSGKINHSFSEAWQLAGTYLFYDSLEPFGDIYKPVLGSSPVFELSGELFRRVHVVAINSTHIPSDSSVLTLRYGYSWFDDSPIASEFTSEDAAALGWQGDWLSQLGVRNFPYILVDDYGFFGSTHGAFVSDTETQWKSQEVSGTFSHFVGSHTLKYGGQWRRLGLDFAVADFFRFNFLSDFTEGPDPRNPGPGSGDALASLLLGLPTTNESDAIITTANEFFIDYFGGFIQDDWRVSSELVLTLGLRIEHETGFQEKNDNFTVGFSRDDPFPVQVNPPPGLESAPGFPLTGGLIYSGVNGAPTHQWDPPSLKLGPRVGFAYSLNESTVIRGGYGIFWAPYAIPNMPRETRVGTVGYTATTQYVGSFDGITPASPGSGSAGSLTDPYPSGLIEPSENSLGLLTQAGGSVHFNDQFRESPYIQKWSIDVQRDIASTIAIKVGYLGSKGSNLALGGTVDSTVNINQLDPQFLSLGSALDEPLPNPFFGISELGALSEPVTLPRGQLLRPFPQFRDVFAHHVSQARSRYDSVRVEVEKKFRGNWGARINYTWGRNRDNVYESNNFISDAARVVFNNRNLDGDFGRSRIDTPHWLNWNGLYRLPSPQGGAAETLLGGWSVSVRGLFRSGFPLTITQRTNNLGRAYGYDHQRPDLTGVDPNVSGSTEDIFANYINPAAFENAPAFTFGNTPHTLDTIRAPKLVNWDVSFEKRTHLGGDVDLSLRFEVINLFNGTFWRGPRSILGRSDFGQITGTRGFPRTVQFMAKVTF